MGLRALATVVRGILYSGVALFALTAAAQLLYRIADPSMQLEWVNAWWMFVTGGGIGIGFTVAVVGRGRETTRPIRLALTIFVSMLGLLASDYTRGEVGMLIARTGHFGFDESRDAVQSVEPNEMDRASARKAVAEALDGSEFQSHGWIFRLGTEGGKRPPGTWYFVMAIDHWIPYRDRPPGDRFDVGDPFTVVMIAQPRSPGAYLVALKQFDSDAQYVEPKDTPEAPQPD